MAVVDLFVLIMIFLFVWYVIVPFFKSVFTKEEMPPLNGEMADIEQKVKTAVAAKEVANQATSEAKTTVDENLHRLDELKGKL